ncbi:acyltransferase family protein [Hymenobacter puniceus]|uniref:acyltransferase family protein n=1 Tax=Hymenobacter sp. BT190 TaxID=2763505 RepID=UPI001650EAC1|nr:acyltransferase [Hymenobacter sp. BT190]MBC6698408.1 acyltransferase [Hymenobacter sp. BT190]
MNRLYYLDSVRGLAAFAVIVYHFVGWRWAETLGFKLTSIVFNGSDAVSLFFVLSGLVLSWKYFEPDTSLTIDAAHYRHFAITRTIRLYIPFLVALAGYYFYGHRHEPVRQLVSEFITNKHLWFEEALLIRGKHDLYGPSWTLEVEMAASLFVPLLALLLRYSRQLFRYVIIGILIFGSSVIFWELFHFCLGMLLTYYFRRIATYDTRQAWWHPYRFGIYLLVAVLFSLRHITRIYPLGSNTTYWLGLLRIDMFQFSGVAAALLLAYIINSPRCQRLLESRPLLFLGRISYSVYLLHWFFVVYTMDHWDKLTARIPNGNVAFIVLLLAVIGATLLAAAVFHRFVERPSIRLGKRLADRLVPQPIAVPN